ncbi:LOW QUALITY PROTEIN: polyhomeotic-like protein 2, partial [Neopelma chrysocephalum]|uniref:LOW QUALITY PROTEIN: polyhomeotic-like protein 2 n=1 Tax=Neopelma chrysocephalum TaxID=114329 RepID=UPI000FCD1EFE
ATPQYHNPPPHSRIWEVGRFLPALWPQGGGGLSPVWGRRGSPPTAPQPPVPWQVGRSSLLVGALHKQYAQELLPDKLPPQDNTTTTDSDMEEPYLQESKEEGTPPKLKCELCGRVDFAYKFKRSKRFCSMACAKRYNVGCTKRVGLFHPDRTKLQKPGGPPHGRRRSCKGPLPPLGKDSKKQVRGHGGHKA